MADKCTSDNPAFALYPGDPQSAPCSEACIIQLQVRVCVFISSLGGPFAVELLAVEVPQLSVASRFYGCLRSLLFCVLAGRHFRMDVFSATNFFLMKQFEYVTPKMGF